MTDYQAKQICALRRHGAGYKAIANATGLSRDIVRNYCKYHGLSGDTEKPSVNMTAQIKLGLACRNCGAPLVQPPTGKRRRYCSDDCKKEWWAAHAADNREKSAANYHLTCAHCGREFTSYGNRKKKYCSFDCYIQHRFYGADRSEDRKKPRSEEHTERREKKGSGSRTVYRKTPYDLICQNCGQQFISYGSPKKKYCCSDCFNQHQIAVRREKEDAAAQAGKELYKILMGTA